MFSYDLTDNSNYLPMTILYHDLVDNITICLKYIIKFIIEQNERNYYNANSQAQNYFGLIVVLGFHL